MTLNPGDGEHGGNECQQAGRTVEEQDGLITVEGCDQMKNAAVLPAVTEKVFEIREQVEDDVEP